MAGEYGDAFGPYADGDIRSVQLIATAALSAVSFWSEGYKNWIQSNQWMMWVSVCTFPPCCVQALTFLQLFGSIAFMLLTYWKRKSYPTNLLFLAGFTGLEAYAISVIVSFYQTKIVLQAVLLTAGIFVALTVFACQTKYDFTSWMPYLFGGLWALILFGFMAAFFPYNSTVELAYSGIAALIFSGYILVDTQLIMRHYHVEEEIAAAISLYLDIINLFLAILRILNSQQNN
jgi:FtsH-binding integral membrane protein